MNLDNFKKLTLREVLELTEGGFFVFAELNLRGDRDSEDRLEIEARGLDISNYDLSKDEIIINISKEWFSLDLHLNLNQTYELDIDSVGLDGEEEVVKIPYSFNDFTVYINNEAIFKRLVDALFDQEIIIPGVKFVTVD